MTTTDTPTRELRIARASTEPVEFPPARLSPEDERDTLIRQLRRVTERNVQQFDLGFQAAVTMVEAGATLERMREASGVVAAEWSDTDVHAIQEMSFDEPTLVEVAVPEDIQYDDTVVADVGDM